ncbi:MAG TPA: hypothetical protein RMH85_00795 [Polyangiaceae bacterium LLY-WYZ-15_(1-7)]|nr:hypothetical protein [Myxococcales bacterium]MBJ72746.1 hypothetical protein [Sandaracinus sp.]HJK89905.1 hypothetical protein [Polyangiaceae bacterium LLY-WYZ-15_(1-7)]HJL06076.1 hypothetical protein [Polyangiaceae bacterium LLY-WYZ-15_(1-7)]HJL06998.1 hypothetical protein [Polyangiaceae bacterium LLY-WYZ-15_(1-7)]
MPRERPLARVARVGGRPGTPRPFRRGQGLGPTATLRTGAEELVLDLRDGGRVELAPHAIARLGDEAPAQLFLGAGQLYASLPPVGSSPRPPLRLGTPAGTVEIGGSGEIWITALPTGSVWVGVLGGRAVAHPAGAEEPVEILAGRSYVLGGEAPTDGPDDRVTAAQLGTQLIEQSSPANAPDTIPPALEALDAALSRVEAVRREGEALTDRHREAVAAGSDEARAIQRELIEHSRTLGRVRRALLGAYETARARALWAQASPDPTAQRRPRIRAALGLETAAE